MATHLIVYGHGAGDPGAVGNGANERDFNRKVLHPHIKKWTDKSKDSFVFFDTTGNKDLYQDTAKGWGIYGMTNKQYQSITEIHEDAASSTATGGHNIIYKSFNADKNDLALAQIIKNIVGWWGSVQNTQGISKRDNLLNLNVAAQRDINYRLIELGFITNKKDMDKIKANLDKYAKGIVEGITGEKLEDVKPTEPNKPTTPKNDRPRHTVVTQWYTKNGSAHKKVVDYIKSNKWNYKETTAKDGRVSVEVGKFLQDSTNKTKLEKWLGDNNLSYETKIL